jgi:NADPH:quinone reductase
MAMARSAPIRKARNAPANRVSKLPDGISDETAAAMMLKGMTVRYLLRQTYKVASGETILFHAAAGGVGLIACQWAKALGATVIGTAGSEEKAELARAHGCEARHPLHQGGCAGPGARTHRRQGRSGGL